MRLILALGVAMAATTVMAQAEDRPTERTQIIVRHGGPGAMDADNDGWVTRAEASASADRAFAALDRNDDARLDEADRPQEEDFDLHLVPPGAPPMDGDNCERTESNDNGERRVTVICRAERETRSDRATRSSDRDQREQRREVIVRRHGDGDADVMIAPMPPHPPMAPHAPMFMMMLGDDSEADLNNDGAISADEFRAQHLRMFDAYDANGDGRIRAPRMPDPPAAPVPPTPPSPPRRG